MTDIDPEHTKITRLAEGMAAAALSRLNHVRSNYYHLALVVTPDRLLRYETLSNIGQAVGNAYVNLNDELLIRLTNVKKERRPIILPGVLEDIMPTRSQRRTIIVNHIEMLFDPALATNPLHALELLARNRTIIAGWDGTLDGEHLRHHEPGHVFYRRYDATNHQEVLLACENKPERISAGQWWTAGPEPESGRMTA